MQIRIGVLISLLASALLMGSSCQIDTSDISTSADHIRRGIEHGAAELASGLRQIDPAGLNRLLSENERLRQQLDSIRGVTNGLSLGEGVITLRERRLALRVPHNTGSFTVTAWVDDRSNWAWQDRRFAPQELILPLKDAEYFVQDCVSHARIPFPFSAVNRQDWCRNAAPHWAENVRSTISRHSQGEVARAFRQFLQEAPLTPGPDVRLIEIGEARLTDGDHTISFEVTPVSPDSNARWSFRGQLVVIAANNSEFIIKEFDLLSERFPVHALNTPLPLVTASIRVSTGGV